MKTWTDQAERRLSEYLDARVRREGLEGLDAIELKEDLRSHVHEELEHGPGERIGTAELEQVLDRLGRSAEPATAGDGRGRRWLFAGGVVLPGLVALFEILTGFCGGVFFDPVPTVFHSLLVLAVPALNAWLLFAGRRADSRWQGMAAGMAVVIAVFYALLFLPLVPASLFALLMVGMGLLSLTPVLAGAVTWRISRRSRAAAARPWRFRSGWRIGALAAVVALLVLEGPAGWTRIQLARAVSEDPEEAAAGLSALRGFHSQRTLLRACYEGNRGTSLATDIPGWIENGWKLPVSMFGRGAIIGGRSAEPVRDVYFRVTGEPFNAVKPPRMVSGGGRGNAWNDFEFDENLGGDTVAMRLKDLDLSESRFDGHVDGVSGLGYGEWTMVFKNRASQAKEARCLVRLPRGGRVSRLTLWVNGEPREAAFSSVEKVKAAYREVAVRQQRDPVLVTMAGPDTVLVQCFPVPARGEMKIRFGLTAALVDGAWELPRIVERNFGLAEQGRHALWIQADRRFSAVGDLEMPAPRSEGEGFAVNSVLPIESVVGGRRQCGWTAARIHRGRCGAKIRSPRAGNAILSADRATGCGGLSIGWWSSSMAPPRWPGTPVGCARCSRMPVSKF